MHVRTIHLVHFTPEVRAAVLRQYGWFIHVTPARNIDSIRRSGILPNRDASPWERFVQAGVSERQIACFVPLGSQLFPGPAANFGPDLPDQAPFVTTAVAGEHMPARLGIDWSYYPQAALWSVDHHAEESSEAVAIRLLHKHGSVVSYDSVPPVNVRVYCQGNPPMNPLAWRSITAIQDSDSIVRHRLS